MNLKSVFITCFICLFGTISIAQNSISNYKYIIVPDQYEFVTGKDKYQLNSLTKFLFNKYGYTAVMVGEEFPDELSMNRCLGLTSEVKKLKGFLKTKLQIDLIDCDGNIVMSSQRRWRQEKRNSKRLIISH